MNVSITLKLVDWLALQKKWMLSIQAEQWSKTKISTNFEQVSFRSGIAISDFERNCLN